MSLYDAINAEFTSLELLEIARAEFARLERPVEITSTAPLTFCLRNGDIFPAILVPRTLCALEFAPQINPLRKRTPHFAYIYGAITVGPCGPNAALCGSCVAGQDYVAVEAGNLPFGLMPQELRRPCSYNVFAIEPGVESWPETIADERLWLNYMTQLFLAVKALPSTITLERIGRDTLVVRHLPVGHCIDYGGTYLPVNRIVTIVGGWKAGDRDVALRSTAPCGRDYAPLAKFARETGAFFPSERVEEALADLLAGKFVRLSTKKPKVPVIGARGSTLGKKRLRPLAPLAPVGDPDKEERLRAISAEMGVKLDPALFLAPSQKREIIEPSGEESVAWLMESLGQMLASGSSWESIEVCATVADIYEVLPKCTAETATSIKKLLERPRC